MWFSDFIVTCCRRSNNSLEGRAQMHRQVLVALLKSLVLGDEVQVVPSDDNGPLHLHLGNHACQDSASDADIACEWALLVNVAPLLGLK